MWREQSLNQSQKVDNHALDFSFQSAVFTVCWEKETTANVLVSEHQFTLQQYWNTWALKCSNWLETLLVTTKSPVTFNLLSATTTSLKNCLEELLLPRQAPNVNAKSFMITFRVSPSPIRWLARRGGVKRVSVLIFEETCGVLKVFFENVVCDAVTYTEHAKCKTVTALDVVYALKRQGFTLHEFGDRDVPWRKI